MNQMAVCNKTRVVPGDAPVRNYQTVKFPSASWSYKAGNFTVSVHSHCS